MQQPGERQSERSATDGRGREQVHAAMSVLEQRRGDIVLRRDQVAHHVKRLRPGEEQQSGASRPYHGAMLEVMLLAPVPGILARLAWPNAGGVLMTLVASLLGWAIGYLVFHELMGFHELHAFQLEGVLPGTAGALLALTALRRVAPSRRERRLFTRR